MLQTGTSQPGERGNGVPAPMGRKGHKITPLDRFQSSGISQVRHGRMIASPEKSGIGKIDLVESYPKTCRLVLESYSWRSNRALKIDPRGVFSCVFYGKNLAVDGIACLQKSRSNDVCERSPQKRSISSRGNWLEM